jgi:hypothetical protein
LTITAIVLPWQAAAPAAPPVLAAGEAAEPDGAVVALDEQAARSRPSAATLAASVRLDFTRDPPLGS